MPTLVLVPGAVELRYLDAGLDELWARVSARNGTDRWRWRPITRGDLAAWSRDFEAPGPDELG